MGVDTKMFVTVGKDKLYDVLEVAIDTLNKWQRAQLDKYVEENTEYNTRVAFLWSEDEEAKKWSNGVSCDFHFVGCINVNFKVGENRRLAVIADIESDYSDVYEGEKIIFSLGCWGKSAEIMEALFEPMKQFGRVFYVYDDCSGEDFKEV